MNKKYHDRMGQQNDTEDTHGGIDEVMVAKQQLVVGSIPTWNFDGC